MYKKVHVFVQPITENFRGGCMNEMELVGRRIKFLRIGKNVTQTSMAEQIGMSQTNLSNLETGRTAITLANLFKIKEVLGCKMRDFFVDFDGEAEETTDAKQDGSERNSIELKDALNILKLLKAVDVKGL